MNAIDPGDVFWLTAIGLGVTVAITTLIWTWYQIRAWYWDGDDPAADAGAFLSAIRESTREGELSDEEYRSIQSRLANQIQGTLPTATPKTISQPQSLDDDESQVDVRSTPDENQA